MNHPDTITLRRSLPVPPERVWELWTTPEGIGAWWAPDGFRTTVEELDLRPGGALDYTMTAVGPEQVAFMEQAGMPLSTRSHKEFTEVGRPHRLAYLSTIDFVPGVDPYDHLTVVTLEATATGTEVVMECEPLHDRDWTDRIVAGRTNELDNLERLVTRG
ncbi:SRPBCC family protein [Nocardioides sp.]|uniref:SRPBCC family protein n=1 Tax=Nocardioides sp. TaxID=35761 RepID=UPI002ED9B3F2